MSEPPSSLNFQAAADKAVLGICELLGLLFGLPFGEDLYRDRPFGEIPVWHWLYLAIGIFFAGAGFMFPWVRTRTWIPEIVSTSLSKAALDARYWIAALLTIFIYMIGPEIYHRAVEPARSPSRHNEAQQPHENLTSEDVSTKISIWDSILNSNLNMFVSPLNSLDEALSRWPKLIDSVEGRRQLSQDITNALAAYAGASKDLDILKSEFPNYKDIADVLDQPHRSELERTAHNFANAISDIPQTPAPNFEIPLRPLAGALNREMDATKSWLNALRATARQNREALSSVK